MSLIACADCGKQVSDSAPTCPGCGRPLKRVANAESVVVKTIVLLFLLAMLGGALNYTGACR